MCESTRALLLTMLALLKEVDLHVTEGLLQLGNLLFALGQLPLQLVLSLAQMQARAYVLCGCACVCVCVVCVCVCVCGCAWVVGHNQRGGFKEAGTHFVIAAVLVLVQLGQHRGVFSIKLCQFLAIEFKQLLYDVIE